MMKYFPRRRDLAREQPERAIFPPDFLDVMIHDIDGCDSHSLGKHTPLATQRPIASRTSELVHEPPNAAPAAPKIITGVS